MGAGQLNSANLSWEDYRTWLGRIAPGFQPPAVTPPRPADLNTDTRSIQAGEWFVPLDGATFDGHAFVAEAMNRGAAGFFYETKKKDQIPEALRARGIAVDNTLMALQAIAGGWRRTLKDLTLLAITGSTGKTTTKEMLSAILRAAGPTYATEASFNNEIGVPKSLLKLTPEHRFAALEFGARKAHDIRFLVQMATPDVGGVINVGKTHVEIFGSLETLLETKLEMFTHAKDGMVQVTLADDPRLVEAARRTGRPTWTFGTSADADVAVVGSAWEPDGAGMKVVLRINREKRDLTINLGVAHGAFPINAAGAAALAIGAGVPSDAVVEGLRGFTGIKGRYQVHRKGALTVIDDSYNASPDSMRSGLQTVGESYRGKRLVLVLGDMLELGTHAAPEHAKVGAQAAGLAPELLVAVGPLATDIAAGAAAAGLARQRIRQFSDVGALLDAALPYQDLGDVIYVKASRGVRLDRVVTAVANKGDAR